MRRSWPAAIIASLALFGLAIPAMAAAPKQYVLKHPKHERCKAHYVKRVEHARTWCVAAKVLTPTATSVDATGYLAQPGFEGMGGSPAYVAVSGSIWPGTYPGLKPQLVGLPITYTITNAITGQTVGSFTGVSNLYATCTIVETITEQFTVITYTGEAVVPYQGCPLASPIRIPAAEPGVLKIRGSFAGNSTYAPSVSEPKVL